MERLRDDLSDIEIRKLLDVISAKADTIVALNENIVNRNDIEDIAGELFEGND